MIGQVLDSAFVLDRIQKAGELPRLLQGDGDNDLARFLASAELEPTEWRSALGDLQTAVSAWTAEDPVDDSPVFIPHSAELSVFQSVLEQFYEEQRPDLIVERPSGQGGRPETTPVTNRRLVGVAEPDGGHGLFERFFKADIGWSSVAWAKGMKWFKGKHPFNFEPAPPLRIDDRARVLLVGDWGSGIPRAVSVAQQMRKVLDQGLAKHIEQHVIHLGDVYYSGFAWEYKKRFLAHWPVREAESSRITSWSLNANHDMYTGGHGYFGTLLADPRFARQRRSSYLSLYNQHWRILGLDTGYQDHDLYGPQAAWAATELQSGQKGLLLSHHQPFDQSGDAKGRALESKLRPLLAAGKIRSWFWGHEHECVLFKPHLGVQFGRCIGHGGVPAYAKIGVPPDRVIYDYRERFLQEVIERWALFGFVVLDFHDQSIKVRYFDENGYCHREETID